MSSSLIVALAVAAALLIAFVVCISRMNPIRETDEVEPSGDFVDLKSFWQRWEDRK